MESSDRAVKMLAAALEKEEKGRDFYKQAVEKCSNELGKDMFRTLAAEEAIHIKRIKEIYETLSSGEKWSLGWKAHKFENEDLQKLIRARISKLGPKIKAGTGDLEAVRIGIEMEQSAIKFYEEQNEKASDPLEKDFIQCMIGEERSHYASLNDVRLFFENPESWFAEKERHTLDGA